MGLRWRVGRPGGWCWAELGLENYNLGQIIYVYTYTLDVYLFFFKKSWVFPGILGHHCSSTPAEKYTYLLQRTSPHTLPSHLLIEVVMPPPLEVKLSWWRVHRCESA
jgi:hypothetical protein